MESAQDTGKKSQNTMGTNQTPSTVNCAYCKQEREMALVGATATAAEAECEPINGIVLTKLMALSPEVKENKEEQKKDEIKEKFKREVLSVKKPKCKKPKTATKKLKTTGIKKRQRKANDHSKLPQQNECVSDDWEAQELPADMIELLKYDAAEETEGEMPSFDDKSIYDAIFSEVPYAELPSVAKQLLEETLIKNQNDYNAHEDQEMAFVAVAEAQGADVYEDLTKGGVDETEGNEKNDNKEKFEVEKTERKNRSKQNRKKKTAAKKRAAKPKRQLKPKPEPVSGNVNLDEDGRKTDILVNDDNIYAAIFSELPLANLPHEALCLLNEALNDAMDPNDGVKQEKSCDQE